MTERGRGVGELAVCSPIGCSRLSISDAHGSVLTNRCAVMHDRTSFCRTTWAELLSSATAPEQSADDVAHSIGSLYFASPAVCGDCMLCSLNFAPRQVFLISGGRPVVEVLMFSLHGEV